MSKDLITRLHSTFTAALSLTVLFVCEMIVIALGPGSTSRTVMWIPTRAADYRCIVTRQQFILSISLLRGSSTTILFLPGIPLKFWMVNTSNFVSIAPNTVRTLERCEAFIAKDPSTLTWCLSVLERRAALRNIPTAHTITAIDLCESGTAFRTLFYPSLLHVLLRC